MNFNTRGRYLPALLLTGILLLSLDFNLEKQLEILKSSSLAVAGSALLIILMRTTSTAIYETWFFDRRKKFPTTTILLENSDYSASLRKALGEQGYIGLSSSEDLPKSIRQLTRDFRENEIVRSANIDYSFVRNFSGGVLLLIVVQIVALYFLNNVYKTLIFMAAESAYFAFSFLLVKVTAEKYAEALFTEFLRTVRGSKD